MGRSHQADVKIKASLLNIATKIISFKASSLAFLATQLSSIYRPFKNLFNQDASYSASFSSLRMSAHCACTACNYVHSFPVKVSLQLKDKVDITKCT